MSDATGLAQFAAYAGAHKLTSPSPSLMCRRRRGSSPGCSATGPRDEHLPGRAAESGPAHAARPGSGWVRARDDRVPAAGRV